MRHEDDALLIAQSAQRLQYDALVDAVNVARRLIEQYESAAAQQRPRQTEPLLLARGEIVAERADAGGLFLDESAVRDAAPPSAALGS